MSISRSTALDNFKDQMIATLSSATSAKLLSKEKGEDAIRALNEYRMSIDQGLDVVERVQFVFMRYLKAFAVKAPASYEAFLSETGEFIKEILTHLKAQHQQRTIAQTALDCITYNAGATPVDVDNLVKLKAIAKLSVLDPVSVSLELDLLAILVRLYQAIAVGNKVTYL